MKITLAVLLLFFTAFCCSAQKVTLALNLKKDSTYYLISDARVTIEEDVNGQHQVINTGTNVRVAHKVLSIRDTIYDMELAYKSIAMHLEVGGKMMDFNSKSDRQDIFSKIMGTIIDKPFLMSISKSGKVVSMSNTENIYADMFKDFPQITAEQKLQFKAQVQKSFGESVIQRNFQDAFAIFPKTPIAQNQQWNTKTILEASGMTIDVNTNYTLNSITDNAYLIKGEASITPGNTMPYKEINGMQMRFVDFKGTITDQLKLNKETCWIEESRAARTVSGTAEVKDSIKTPGGLKFPMLVILSITVSNK